MTLDSVIMLVGAIIALLPFLGFPQRWDTVLFFLLGVVVIALGIAVRRGGSKLARPQPPKRTAAYVESKASDDTTHGQGTQH